MSFGHFGGMYGAMYSARAASEAGSSARQASSHARDAQRSARYLEERLDKLLLVNMAMWELLKERTDLTEEDLMSKVQQLDMQDGRDDGKLQKGIAKCHQCGRTVSHRHSKCLYCGATKAHGSAYDSAS
jgi:flavin-dependent dehydrogenase